MMGNKMFWKGVLQGMQEDIFNQNSYCMNSFDKFDRFFIKTEIESNVSAEYY